MSHTRPKNHCHSRCNIPCTAASPDICPFFLEGKVAASAIDKSNGVLGCSRSSPSWRFVLLIKATGALSKRVLFSVILADGTKVSICTLSVCMTRQSHETNRVQKRHTIATTSKHDRDRIMFNINRQTICSRDLRSVAIVASSLGLLSESVDLASLWCPFRSVTSWTRAKRRQVCGVYAP